ncbi:MAG: hypothetical protein ACXADY_18475 [Candidatus Hodarchaeales archaeon]|jgi:hypothetical protein
MSGTRGRKAVTFTGSSEAIKFLDNLISAYVGQDNYFTDYFFRLGNYDDFKGFCDEAWQSVLHELAKNEQKQYSTNTTSKAFFTNFITQLSFFQQRLGVYLKQKVLTQLQDMSNKYIPPKIDTLHSLSRVDTFDKTKQAFCFENSNLVRMGSMEEITDVDDLNKEVIAIFNLKEDTKKAIIHHTENHLLNALTQLSDVKYDKKEQSKPIEAFQTIFTGYKSWINKSNENVKKSLSKVYRDMMKTLEDIFNLLEEENVDLEEEEVIVKKLLINDIERLKEINNSLTESSYKGRSFPAFPGIIRSSHITALSPSFQSGSVDEIQTNRYLIPICGSGWNKTQNTFSLLIELIWLVKSIRELDEDQFANSILLTDLEGQINRYFKQLEIKIEQLKLEDYKLLQNLIVKEGSLQELHEFVISSISTDISYSFVEYQQKRGSTENITFKSDIKLMDEETQHVLLINNNWGKTEEETEYGWNYRELDTLPEIITYLLSNSGIWPKKIEIHLMDANLYIWNKRWKNSQNNDLFRWLKATIDSITLYLIMNREINLFPGNSFFDLTVKDKLLLIPILNNNQSRTQTHTYYYDLVDGLIAQDTIKDDLEGKIPSKNVFLNQQKSTSQDEMYNLLDNYFQSKFQTHAMNPITNRINLQHFNRLSLYKKEKITEKFNKNLPILKNPNLIEPVLDFLETFGYTAEVAVAYLTDPKNEGRKNVPNEMSYIKFQTKESDRTIILPLLFFVFLIENLGGKSGKALSSIYVKLDETNYRRIIADFMEQEYIQKSLKTLSGQLFETHGGIGKVTKTNLSVWRTDSSVLLDDSNLDDKSFYVVLIEAHTIQSYDDLNRDSMVRIYIVKYSTNNAPRIIFNEYFLCDKNKNHLDYRRFVEEIIFLLMFRLDEYVFVSIKNMSGIGEFLARKQNLSISQGVWNRFRNLSQTVIEKLQTTNKTNKLFGYVNNFGMIPLTTYKTQTGQDLHFTIWEFSTAFLNEDLSGYQIDKYNFFNILISRPKSRSHHFKKKKKSDKEIPNFNIYSKLDAIVTLQAENSKLPEKVIEEVKDLMKLGLLLGGEAAKIGTVGFSRLFHYPYSDRFRIVYSPSILLKGVDFFVLG